MRAARLFLLFLLTIPMPLAAADALSIGNSITDPSSSDGNIAEIRTDIDLTQPASHSGNLLSAQVYWSSSGCANAFKIKFFRRTGETLTLVAERGPFTPSANVFTTALSPGVAVQQGDLIGVSRIASCGNPGVALIVPPMGDGYLQYPGDVIGSIPLAAGTRNSGMLAVSASGSASERMERVIPVVGSSPGAFGSYFRTEMQFFNPDSHSSMVCKLVFHPAGSAGSSADATRLVTLDPREIFSTPDVVAAMGQSGTGSIDVSVPAGQAFPMLLVRVYNDAGAAGTSGLTEPAIAVPDEIGMKLNTNVLVRGIGGHLITPRDPGRTRFNVGVRTLYSGATLDVTVRNASGIEISRVTRTYTANYFEQVEAAAFAGAPVGGDQSIEIMVMAGSAIIYGSTTDNTTNDPAIHFVYGSFGVF